MTGKNKAAVRRTHLGQTGPDFDYGVPIDVICSRCWARWKGRTYAARQQKKLCGCQGTWREPVPFSEVD
jgi:hypothetical protein